MAPSERIRLPFRWQFRPERNLQDGSVTWTWRAYTQTDKLAMKSDRIFDNLSECMADAKAHGYSD